MTTPTKLRIENKQNLFYRHCVWQYTTDGSSKHLPGTIAFVLPLLSHFCECMTHRWKKMSQDKMLPRNVLEKRCRAHIYCVILKFVQWSTPVLCYVRAAVWRVSSKFWLFHIRWNMFKYLKSSRSSTKTKLS